MKQNYVYILSNKGRSTLYIGVTNNLLRRIDEHLSDCVEGFSKKYKTHALVYYEAYTNILDAIAREKQLKGWSRQKKIDLIKTLNPNFIDLTNEICE